MLPTREKAEELLKEALPWNPGPWGDHSRVAAHCAEKIAENCGMDAEKAYILGLLHDIGRKFGVRHLGHVSDGYSYMMELGYDEAARICLTHSFHNQNTDEYIGKFDTTEEELALIRGKLAQVRMDDYDRLIQLCDSLAGAEGVLDIEERMGDVRRRYGAYPRPKWDSNLALKRYFEEKMGRDIYDVVEKDSYRPQSVADSRLPRTPAVGEGHDPPAENPYRIFGKTLVDCLTAMPFCFAKWPGGACPSPTDSPRQIELCRAARYRAQSGCARSPLGFVTH